MSEYTPTEQELIEGSTVSEDERRRAIASIKAEAWDEGNRAGASDQAAWDGWRYYPRDKHPIPNPYREDDDE